MIEIELSFDTATMPSLPAAANGFFNTLLDAVVCRRGNSRRFES